MSNEKKEEKTICNHAESFSEKLFKLRQPRTFIMPEKSDVQSFAEEFLQILFPHFGKKDYFSPQEIEAELILLKKNLLHILKPLQELIPIPVEDVAETFCIKSAGIHDKLILDAEAILKGDPAAENIDEVIVAYPGFYAIAIYRVAHEFYLMNVPIFPRILTEYAHQLTGIDIHPGATIGDSFFIDHGTGIVIGETSIIGENVKIYQGVTLGALSVNKKLANTKRHPTIEHDTVIYSGATILGGETVIGHHSVIGGNVWLTESVPPESVVYHKSQVKVRSAKDFGEEPLNFVI
ncbi:MAG: serine acetyltransferase [Ignavibacteriales bacterium]|nr:serine acetyltransferase [Ignavibacteriales bacterium]